MMMIIILIILLSLFCLNLKNKNYVLTYVRVCGHLIVSILKSF